MSFNKRELDMNIDDIPLAKRMHLTPTRRSSMLSSDAISESESSDIDKKREHDKYCWKCHKRSGDEMNCSTCMISYHKYCTDTIREKKNWTCPECEKALNIDESLWNGESLVKYISYVFERMTRKNDFFSGVDNYLNAETILNPLKFANIRQKVLKYEYPSMNSFLMDLKWLLHNIEIQRKIDRPNKNKLTEFRDVVEKWIKNCIIAIDSIKTCTDCYLKNNSSDQLSVCSKPHIVVWVQYGIYPYWPAKLLSTNYSESNPIEVIFFDENKETGLVKYSQCYLYSKEDPNDYITDEFQNDIQLAKEAADKYIKEVEKQFGPFQYAPVKTKPIKGKIDTEHLDFMIPGFRDLSLRPKQNDNNISEAIEEEQNNDVRPQLETQASDEQPVATTPGKIRLPIKFVKEMQFCRKYFIALKSQYDSQVKLINELREENNDLKAKNCALTAENIILKEQNNDH